MPPTPIFTSQFRSHPNCFSCRFILKMCNLPHHYNFRLSNVASYSLLVQFFNATLFRNRLFLKLHLTLRLPIIRYLFKKYSYVFVFVAPINNTFDKVRYALPVLLWTASFYRVLYHIRTLIHCPFYMKIIPIHLLLRLSIAYSLLQDFGRERGRRMLSSL